MIDERWISREVHPITSYAIRAKCCIAGICSICMKSCVRNHPIVTGNKQRSCTCSMRSSFRSFFYRARAIVDDRCTRQLWGTCLDWPINHCDRDTRARVSLRSGLVEVIVGKVGLVSGSNGVCCPCRRSGNYYEPQGTSGRASNRERYTQNLVLGGHHWRGSHPSSSRFAGARSLSDPYVCDMGFT